MQPTPIGDTIQHRTTSKATKFISRFLIIFSFLICNTLYLAHPDSPQGNGGCAAPLADNSVIQLEIVVKMNTIE